MLLAGQWEGFTQASQLQQLAVTTDHPPLPSVEDQLCKSRVVVLKNGLYLSTGKSGSGISWVVQTKVRPHLCPAHSHRHELQSYLQVATTCVSLEVPRRNQAVNLGWLLLMPGLGPLSSCLFDRIWEIVKHDPRPDIHIEKSWLTI